MVTCLSPLPHTTCVLNTTLKSSHWGLPLIVLQYYIIVCLSWRGVCTKFKMKNSQIIIQKSALDTVLLYLNATGKTNALLFQTIPNTIKKNHNKWNKNTTHRKKYKPASSILLCSFRGCIIFTSPPPPQKKEKENAEVLCKAQMLNTKYASEQWQRINELWSYNTMSEFKSLNASAVDFQLLTMV